MYASQGDAVGVAGGERRSRCYSDGSSSVLLSRSPSPIRPLGLGLITPVWERASRSGSELPAVAGETDVDLDGTGGGAIEAVVAVAGEADLLSAGQCSRIISLRLGSGRARPPTPVDGPNANELLRSPIGPVSDCLRPSSPPADDPDASGRGTEDALEYDSLNRWWSVVAETADEREVTESRSTDERDEIEYRSPAEEGFESSELRKELIEPGGGGNMPREGPAEGRIV